MSFRIVREVRQAFRTGQIKQTGKYTRALDGLVLMLLADEARDNDRRVKIGMSQLEAETGYERSAISRSVHRLEDMGCLRIVGYGGKGRPSVYEFPDPIQCGTTATRTDSDQCGTTATRNAPIMWQSGPDHVAVRTRSCGTTTAHPGKRPGKEPGTTSLRSVVTRARRTKPAAEPKTISDSLAILREHASKSSRLTVREIGLHEWGGAPTKSQLNGTRGRLNTAVYRGLAEMEDRPGGAVYWPLRTDGWKP